MIKNEISPKRVIRVTCKTGSGADGRARGNTKWADRDCDAVVSDIVYYNIVRAGEGGRTQTLMYTPMCVHYIRVQRTGYVYTRSGYTANITRAIISRNNTKGRAGLKALRTYIMYTSHYRTTINEGTRV